MGGLPSPCAVEKALSSQWQRHPDGREMRACLFNVVVYRTHRRTFPTINETLEALSQRFPCRIIALSLVDDAQSSPSLQAAVYQGADGKAAHGSERIDIGVLSSQTPFLANLVLPYLVTDLPIYLLWSIPTARDEGLLQALLPHASRLIYELNVDLCEEGCVSYLRRVAEIAQRRPASEVMDLHWAQLAGWRGAIARVFTPEEDMVSLQHAGTLLLRYHHPVNDKGRQSITQPLYLVSWLAARLQWRLAFSEWQGDRLLLRYSHGPSHCNCVLEPVPVEQPEAAAISSLEIVCEGGNSYNMIADKLKNTLQAHITHRDFCEMPYALPLCQGRKGYPFIKEVLHNNMGSHYLPALHQLIILAEQLHHASL